MLKEKDLIKNVTGFRVKDKDNDLNFDTIKNVIAAEVPDYDYRVTFTLDELKSGGMFNSKTEKVLVVTNSDHPYDYYKYVFCLGKQGIFTIYNVFLAGHSKLVSKDARRQQKYANSSFAGGMAMNIAHSIHNNDDALDKEQGYYNVFENDILPQIAN